MLEESLREELVGMMDNGWAHEGPALILADFPMERINDRAPNVPYSAWQLLEHIRFCQREVLEQIEAEVMPEYHWQTDFWSTEYASPERWQETLDGFFADKQRLQQIAREANLLEPCRHHKDRSVLHAILNVAAHNHYHLGEFSILRTVMQSWDPNRVDTMSTSG